MVKYGKMVNKNCKMVTYGKKNNLEHIFVNVLRTLLNARWRCYDCLHNFEKKSFIYPSVSWSFCNSKKYLANISVKL